MGRAGWQTAVGTGGALMGLFWVVAEAMAKGNDAIAIAALSMIAVITVAHAERRVKKPGDQAEDDKE